MSKFIYCENCDRLIDIKDVKVKKEKRTYNFKGKLVTAEIFISYCKRCSNEVYNRETEIENDKIIFKERSNG